MNILRIPPARFAREPTLPFLVWITISGTFPIHIFVPALPDAARDLQISPAAIQLTITSYLVGLSIGQLILGGLSDRFGRRPVLLIGLLLYVVTSAVAAVASNIAVLVAARIFQAIGGCAGLVLGRAITRDTAGAEKATARMAMLGASISIGPALAPIIGAQIALHMGWRAVFVVLAVVNFALLLMAVLTLPETYVPSRENDQPGYVSRYLKLLRTPVFIQFCVGGALATTSFYAFLVAAPFFLKARFALSVDAVGIVFLAVVGCLTMGSLLASKVARFILLKQAVKIASTSMLLASLVLLFFCLTGQFSIWSVLVPIMVLTFSIGLCSPFAMVGAVNVDPISIGAASGLYGCLQMAAGALIITSVGIVPVDDLTLAMTLVLLTASTVAFVCFWLPSSEVDNAAQRTAGLEEIKPVVDLIERDAVGH